MRFKCLIVSALLSAVSLSASAATLDFDDLPNFTDMSTVSPYNGLNWTAYTSYTDTALNYDGWANGVVSQPGAIFSGGELNSPGNEITGTFSGAGGSTFTLNSAYLGAAYREGEEVVVVGLNGVTPVFSDTLTLTTLGAQKFTFNETGLTSVTVTPVFGTGTDPYSCGNFNCTQFTMDNLEINDPIPSGAPEPASLALTALAGLGLFGIARRYRQA